MCWYAVFPNKDPVHISGPLYFPVQIAHLKFLTFWGERFLLGITEFAKQDKGQSSFDCARGLTKFRKGLTLETFNFQGVVSSTVTINNAAIQWKDENQNLRLEGMFILFKKLIVLQANSPLLGTWVIIPDVTHRCLCSWNMSNVSVAI